MYQLPTTKEQRFNDRLPLSIVAILAVVQMLATFAIVTLEIGHNLLHMKLTNLLVGFWAAIPFTVLWLSMFGVVCCCRRRSCATHAVVQNILALIFACILIGINILFIRHPNKCFFTRGICQKLTWISYLSDSIECLVDGLSSDCGNTRISLILSQLIAGVLLAMTCVIYLILYFLIVFRISRANRHQIPPAAQPLLTPIYASKEKGMPMTVSHHHHSYTISSHPYQTSPPVMIPVYPPQVPTLSPEGHYMNYLMSNQYATIPRHLTNERF